MTSVLVLSADGTRSTFAGCYADEFTSGHLTVTALYSHLEVANLPPSAWCVATVYDEGGDELYVFRNDAKRG